jgi:hypothetical protein
MKIPNYAHRVSTFQQDGVWFVRIERLLPDGQVHWVNDQPLPTPAKAEDWELFESFMSKLGEVVGLDSPGIRAHFGIDSE